MPAVITSVNRSLAHSFSKPAEACIRLLAGLGVKGDAHSGTTVRHRSRVARNTAAPNLRQVHLLQAELLDELRSAGFAVSPGVVGENLTTRGLDLLALPQGTLLRLGESAVVSVTGLRNPCHQLDDYQAGLMQAVLARDARGKLIRKAGIMGIVVAGGEVRIGDPIAIELPLPPHAALEPV